MRNRLTGLILAAGILVGCGPQHDYSVGPGTMGQTPINSYDYVQYVDVPGPTVQPKEHVYFQIHMRTDDTLVYSTRINNRGNAVHFAMPDFTDRRVVPTPEIEGLSLMSAGDSLTVIYPADSLIRRPAGVKKTDRYVYYDIYLQEILDAADYQQRQEKERGQVAAAAQALRTRQAEVALQTAQLVRDYKDEKLEGRLTTSPNGLQWMSLEVGDGPRASNAQMVYVNYYGMLADGKSFDNSFQRGRAFPLVLGKDKVIKGWEEAILQMREGEKAFLVIPPALGYGTDGLADQIPPDATLFIYMELAAVGAR